MTKPQITDKNRFEHWALGFIWDLSFEIYDLKPCLVPDMPD